MSAENRINRKEYDSGYTFLEVLFVVSVITLLAIAGYANNMKKAHYKNIALQIERDLIRNAVAAAKGPLSTCPAPFGSTYSLSSDQLAVSTTPIGLGYYVYCSGGVNTVISYVNFDSSSFPEIRSFLRASKSLNSYSTSSLERFYYIYLRDITGVIDVVFEKIHLYGS